MYLQSLSTCASDLYSSSIMGYIKALAVVVLMVAVEAMAQGNQYLPPKNPPPAPPSTYLPPPAPTEEGYLYPAPAGEKPRTAEPDHAHHEPGMPFAYKYAVKDDSFGTDFSENAESDGDVVRGEYRVALPDGRLQIVRYTADWKNGYNAEVSYEGTAVYPEPSNKKTNGGY